MLHHFRQINGFVYDCSFCACGSLDTLDLLVRGLAALRLSDPVPASCGLSDPCLDTSGVSAPGLSDPFTTARVSYLAARGLSDPGLSDPVPATRGLSDPCLDACGLSAEDR
jgi:hypothetical protein